MKGNRFIASMLEDRCSELELLLSTLHGAG